MRTVKTKAYQLYLGKELDNMKPSDVYKEQQVLISKLNRSGYKKKIGYNYWYNGSIYAKIKHTTVVRERIV